MGGLGPRKWSVFCMDEYSWRLVPPHTIVAMQELYQQMLPTKLYHQRKTGKGSGTSNVTCGICGELPESVLNVLVGCRICLWILGIELVQDSVLMYQPENLAMHNATLKILFFEMLKII